MYYIAENEFKTLSYESVKCEAQKGINGILGTFRRFLETLKNSE